MLEKSLSVEGNRRTSKHKSMGSVREYIKIDSVMINRVANKNVYVFVLMLSDKVIKEINQSISVVFDAFYLDKQLLKKH